MSIDDDHIDLSGLLLGELTNAEVSTLADHLDGCESCRDVLAELAVGHALLSSASRTLGPVGLVPNPAPGLPAGVSGSRRARRLRRGLLLVAAAVVVIAVGVTGALRLGSDEPTPAAKPFTEARLEPVQGSAKGVVLMIHDAAASTRMTIETQDLPTLREGRFYYAWLLDPQTNKMLPLGLVGPGGVASFTLDDALLRRYTAVDVSLENDDGDPQHSVTSVLRAMYKPGTGSTSTS